MGTNTGRSRNGRPTTRVFREKKTVDLTKSGFQYVRAPTLFTYLPYLSLLTGWLSIRYALSYLSLVLYVTYLLKPPKRTKK